MATGGARAGEHETADAGGELSTHPPSMLLDTGRPPRSELMSQLCDQELRLAADSTGAGLERLLPMPVVR